MAEDVMLAESQEQITESAIAGVISIVHHTMRLVRFLIPENARMTSVVTRIFESVKSSLEASSISSRDKLEDILRGDHKAQVSDAKALNEQLR